jgi:uncharacterized membrane protein YcaP (DUF421 family)
MNPVLRTVVMYAFLLVLFRLAGKRSLAQITTFDFILLLIISEATQNALIGNDFSLTNGMLVVLTLVALDIGLALWQQRFPTIEKLLSDLPVVLVDEGELLSDRLRRARVSEEDILHAARQLQGLERLEQIKYAVLERSGGITIVPSSPANG